jgi:tRNA 2-thiouridine synthesizing protein B
MILHTVNASPDSSAFVDSLRIAQAGDTILLMGDACYAAVANSKANLLLAQSPSHIVILQPDAQARGLSARLSPGITAIDFDEFAALTEQHARQMAWY